MTENKSNDTNETWIRKREQLLQELDELMNQLQEPKPYQLQKVFRRSQTLNDINSNENNYQKRLHRSITPNPTKQEKNLMPSKQQVTLAALENKRHKKIGKKSFSLLEKFLRKTKSNKNISAQ